MNQRDQDVYFMRRALELAHTAQENLEVPVGAVLVRGESVIGEGYNSPISQNDVSAHAEINALRDACKREANYRLPDTTLYVTLEPCAMCAGALIHARIKRVVIATREPRAGAGGSMLNVLDNQNLNHRCQLEFGVLGEESSALLTQFFKSRREQAKLNKRLTRQGKEPVE